MKKIISTFPLLLTLLVGFSQSPGYLMKIDGREIDSKEFLRVYNKNNNITPETEKKSIDEYLDLFINYKLKVIESENRGYDTMQSFIDEFGGYRDQLAKPYIQNEEIKADLIQEAYSRHKEEVNAAHILIQCDENASPEDTLKAFEKVSEIRTRLLAGEPFDEVAKATSDDPSVKENAGKLGYFSAFSMVYPFESGAYNTKVGQLSKPVRTRYGYHLIKVLDKRQSRGSVKVAHCMTRIPYEASAPEKEAAKEKIDKAYLALMNGKSWEEVVQEFSENPRTKANNGDVGWLQSGQAPPEFLDVCFKLDTGKFSKPIETSGGYHIAFILEKKPIESFDEIKEKLSRKVDSDPLRQQTLKDLMRAELISKYGIKKHENKIFALEQYMDSSLYSGGWDFNKAENLSEPVLTVGKRNLSQADFAQFISTDAYQEKESFKTILERKFEEYTEKSLYAYATDMLPKENPDYKYLLQEYHDGILLFNLTNDLVWQKAQEDTVGLKEFYKNADKYLWKERIDVIVYEYKDNSFTAKLPKLIKKHRKKDYNDEYLISALCPKDSIPCISSSSKTYEKGQDALTEKFTWEKGFNTVISKEDVNYFYYIEEVLPPQPKKLDDTKGLYIADYQNYLETKWIVDLREKYSIELNKKELERIKSELK